MCVRPILVREEQIVQCGKCELCLKRRAMAWAFRLMQEEKVSESAYFVTLTYDTKHVPLTRNGFMSLNPEHLQLFFKRLRKKSEKHSSILRSIKYYAVGEYGGTFARPHYHIILFNADLRCLIKEREVSIINAGYVKLDGKQTFPSHTWDYGHVSIGTVSNASVGYTLKYVQKGVWRPRHANDDRVSAFSRMSKGIGINYLSENMCHYHIASLDKNVVATIGKVKFPLPRYYKEKLYWPDELREINRHNEKRAAEKFVKLTYDDLISQVEAGRSSIQIQHYKNRILHE